RDVIVLYRLYYCGVTAEGCAALASALRSNPSHLRELDLSGNKLKDHGLTLLSVVLEDPHCKLEILWLRYCGVTNEGCAALTSALRSNPEHLRELDLSGNKLGNSVNILSAVLANPHFKLEKLWLHKCGLWRCTALASALRSNPSHLRELNLSGNKLGNSVNLVFALLKDPRCKLKILWLSNCGVTDKGCAALTLALRSNPEHLRELNLSQNKLGDSGVRIFCSILKDPRCKLEILWLRCCDITGECCAALTSALRSNPEHLRHLDLSGNKLQKSGVKWFLDLTNDLHYKLERLYY
uniref:Uncharacterized protein n=1 Tax=Cyprinus carpio TaxID=7962 RepID=A0A8C1MS28_CYPCA